MLPSGTGTPSLSFRLPSSRRLFLLSLFASSFGAMPLALHCQQTPTAPSANADLIRLIQAGLPEGVVVNKINAGASQWDTSVDAILAMQKAGATEGELKALTASAISQPPVPATASAAAAAPVPILGGYLTNRGGKVDLFVPGKDPASQLMLHFVLADGRPALLLPMAVRPQDGKHGMIYGEFLIERERVTFFSYGRNGANDQIVEIPDHPAPNVFPMQNLQFVGTHRNWDYYLTNGPTLYWHFVIDQKDDNVVPSIAFIRQLLHDFDGTTATLLRAANISDPATQLTVRFLAPTPEEMPDKLAEINRDHELWLKAEKQWQAAGMQNQQAANGSGFLALMSIMQGVTSMAQATSQSTVAAITHNSAEQAAALQQGMAAQTQVLTVLNNPSAAAVQPVASPDPNAVQNTANQQVAALQAKQTQAKTTAATPQAASPYRFTPVTTLGGNSNQGSGGAAPPQVPLSAPVVNPCIENDVAIIHLDSQWTDATRSEVIGFLTNDSVQDVTCTVAFHKNGQWTDYQIGFLPAGAKHMGGEQGGIWDTGVDSSSMKYACFDGRWPMKADGQYCNANLVFTGQTVAGTDKNDH